MWRLAMHVPERCSGNGVPINCVTYELISFLICPWTGGTHQILNLIAAGLMQPWQANFLVVVLYSNLQSKRWKCWCPRWVAFYGNCPSNHQLFWWRSGYNSWMSIALGMPWIFYIWSSSLKIWHNVVSKYIMLKIDISLEEQINPWMIIRIQ